MSSIGVGHRDDVEVRLPQFRRVAGEAHVRPGEIGRIDLAGTVHSQAESLDAAGVDVETDDARAPAERHRDGQPHVPESDDRDAPAVRHHGTP